jgi:hypothetical protein
MLLVFPTTLPLQRPTSKQNAVWRGPTKNLAVLLFHVGDTPSRPKEQFQGVHRSVSTFSFGFNYQGNFTLKWSGRLVLLILK